MGNFLGSQLTSKWRQWSAMSSVSTSHQLFSHGRQPIPLLYSAHRQSNQKLIQRCLWSSLSYTIGIFPASYLFWLARCPQAEHQFLSKFFLQAHVCKHLQNEAKGCHHLVLWLDCDREGKQLQHGRKCIIEVWRCTNQHFNASIIYKPVCRHTAHVSYDLQERISALRWWPTPWNGCIPPQENESIALDSQQSANWTLLLRW